MDSRELGKVVGECIGGAPGEDTGLTEPAAKELAEVAGLVNERLCSD